MIDGKAELIRFLEENRVKPIISNQIELILMTMFLKNQLNVIIIYTQIGNWSFRGGTSFEQISIPFLNSIRSGYFTSSAFSSFFWYDKKFHFFFSKSHTTLM